MIRRMVVVDSEKDDEQREKKAQRLGGRLRKRVVAVQRWWSRKEPLGVGKPRWST